MKKPGMTPQDRDASMDRLLREAMRADVRSAPGDCLGADTLALWSDGDLSTAEQARAEAHASRCARCQAMLAAMVRTAPPVEAPPRAPFFRWLITLGPAVAAAAAVVLWFAVDRRSTPPILPEQTATTAVGRESQSADAKRAPASPQAPPAETDAFRADADKKDKKEVSDERRAAGDLPSSRVGEVAGALRDKNARAGAAGADAAKVAPKPADRERELMAAASPAPPPPASLPAPPPPPAAPPVTITSTAKETAPIPPVATLDQVQAPQRQNAISATQQAAQTQTGVAANEEKARAQGDRAFLMRQEAGAVLVDSPFPAYRWRVLNGRNVQQSADGGKTWATQYTVDTPTLVLAGAAPSPSVCWLVGQGGLVLVTRDGRTWQRTKFPETVDLRAVTASDANAASVITADGRTFTTSDAGATWTKK